MKEKIISLVVFLILHKSSATSDDIQDRGSCDFESGSDAKLCSYSRGLESMSEFEWQLSADGHYIEVRTENHEPEDRALLYSPDINQLNTHCYSFQYYMEGDNSAKPSGHLDIYVLTKENNILENPVWSANTSSEVGGWQTVQLALVPQTYRVVFKAVVDVKAPGLIAIDNIEVSTRACDDAPHFLRLGDKEVNKAQDVALQCLLYGFNVEAEHGKNDSLKTEVVLQSNKDGLVYTSDNRMVYDDHLGVNFGFDKITKSQTGKYRCIAKSPSEVGISNYASITVKQPPSPTFPPEVIEADSTYLKLNLNTEVFVGDGPIVQKILSYRPTDGTWSDVHHITNDQYSLWHLQPDTDYTISVRLKRPGLGGDGLPGPYLNTTTKCGAPEEAVEITELGPSAPTDLSLTWKKPDFSITRCRFFTYVVKYREHPQKPENVSTLKYNFQETADNFITLHGLKKYTKYDIVVELTHSAGSIETGVYTARTGEDVPGPVPADSFKVVFKNETAITVTWKEPEVKNGDVTQYEVMYRGTSSYQADWKADRDSGLFQTTAMDRRIVTISPLHPGTNYSIGIRAKTAAGFGKVTELSASTDIAPPKMPEYPPASQANNTITPTTIEITLLPAEQNGAPVTRYFVIISEVQSSDDMNEKQGRKKKGKRRKNKKPRDKRDVGRIRRQADNTNEECNSAPMTYEEAQEANKPYYVGGSFDPSEITEETKYTVGGGDSTGGFTNPPLDPNKEYKIFIRADSVVDGKTVSSCTLVAVKETFTPPPATTTVPVPGRVTPAFTDPPVTEDNDKDYPIPISDDNTVTELGPVSVGVIPGDQEKHDSPQPVVMYASIGGGIVLILILTIIIVVVMLRYKKNKGNKRTAEVVNPFEVRMMMTDMSADGDDVADAKGMDRQRLMPDVVAYDQNGDFMDKSRDSDSAPLMSDFASRNNEPPQNCAVRVDDFHIHVSQMRQTNNYGFSEEFASLRDGPTNTWEVAKREENRVKNRYGNIMAYDHSRVILEPLPGHEESFDSDYINANYINGYKNPSMYIATQAPSPETVADFWMMVWQEKSPIIVMVSNLVELGKVKCHKYWPDEHEQYGTIRVSASDEEVLADYSIRTFILQQTDGYDALEVKQFHFTSWPDHGIPTHPTSILAFIRKVKSYEPAGEGPTIVHCSAGAGRSGCYIVTDMMLDMARDEGIVDIYNTISDIRTRRINMVQTEEQYIFIHSAVLEALLCGITSVAANELRQHYDELITVDPQTQVAPVQEEFETLNLMTPKLSDNECSVARLPRNKDKNRFMDVLPADQYLAYLVTPDPQDPESNYINAVFADSYFLKNAFLITQMPLRNTVLDLWRLIYDYNCTSLVMMNDVTEHDNTCCQYWPENGVAAFGPFTVELLNKEDEVDVVTRIFKLQNINRPSEGYRIVQQFQLCNWPASQPVPYSRNAMLRVIQLVNKWQEECAKSVMGRVLVHCVAGAGRSGTFVACHNMCSQLKHEYAVDVFNVVQRLRNVRPQLVETLEQYRFCYEVGWDFAEQ